MGYFPPFNVVHTSKKKEGQVYIGALNYLLMIACILIVLAFRSSERLGGAYGLAVIGTMTVTSLTYFVVLTKVWKWPKLGAIALVGCFLFIDFVFLAGNVVKIVDGAWVPLVLGGFVFAVFWIWTACRARYRRALNAWSMPIDKFRHEVKEWKNRQGVTGVFLTTHPDSVPLVGKNLWLRDHVRPELMILITIVVKSVPYVSEDQMVEVEELEVGFLRVTASFGFMQHPNVTRVLKTLPKDKLVIDWGRLVCYLPEAYIVAKGGWWRQRIQQIYQFMARNSLSAAEYFRVPPGEIIRVGLRLEI
jgi:KUP system potassium uptake protein